MDPSNVNNPKNGLLRDFLVRGYKSVGSDLCHADFEVKSLKSLCRACRNLDADFAKDIRDDNGKIKPVDKWSAQDITNAITGLLDKHDNSSFIFDRASKTEYFRTNPGVLLKKKHHQKFSEYIGPSIPEPDASKAMTDELNDVLANPPVPPPKPSNKRSSAEANLDNQECVQPASKTQLLAPCVGDTMQLMEMIRQAVSGSMDGALSKAGLPELRSDVELVKDKVDKVESDMYAVREANLILTDKFDATTERINVLETKFSEGFKEVEEKIEQASKSVILINAEDIRTAALSYLADKSKFFQSAGDRRRRGCFKITTTNDKFMTRSDTNDGTSFAPNMAAIRQIKKEDFRVLENGVYSRIGDNCTVYMAISCELQGRGYKNDRMIKLMRDKRMKFGGSNLGLRYMHDGGVNYEDTWRDWKQQGLIAGYGYSGSGVDQIRTSENVFILITNPGAVSKLKRRFVTHANLLKIHTNTHFVHEGYLYEFPEGIQRPRPPPSSFNLSGDGAAGSSRSFAMNTDIDRLTRSNSSGVTGVSSFNNLGEISKIKPYSDCVSQKGCSIISKASSGWNGAPSFGSSGSSRPGTSKEGHEYDRFETY